ncbi:phage holin family protein [Nocardia sp. CA-128927]|uniref:phage holin family protein n=1 Tax=Nocardia sp. CA-128927 TaxID=3239975 RepID=UPI003D970318
MTPDNTADIAQVGAPRRPKVNPLRELVMYRAAPVMQCVQEKTTATKSLLFSELKKAVLGTFLIGAALIALLYTTFFVFLLVTEAAETLLPPWAAYFLAALVMLLLSLATAGLGLHRVLRMRLTSTVVTAYHKARQSFSPSW